MHICRTRKTTCMPTSLSPHLPKCFRAQHGAVGLETGRWVDQAEDGMHGFVNQGHSTESRREKEMVIGQRVEPCHEKDAKSLRA